MRFTLRAPDAFRLFLVLCLAAVPAAIAPYARATTAPDLTGRIALDGSTADFAADETVFGLNGAITSAESATDSQWGANEELLGVRITWDRRNLYLAVEGVCWGNNMVLLIDRTDGQGLASMTALNSWRRNIAFSPDFTPDAALATWDTNLHPRLLLHVTGNQVDDQGAGALFDAAASFDQGNAGRSMEARIPWKTLFQYGPQVRDSVLAGQTDTLEFLPPATKLRLAAVLTGGSDGTSGPDVAPNNSTGCPSNGNDLLTVDNFAIVDLDTDADGLPDMGASPVLRVSFKDVALPVRTSSWGRLKAEYR